MKASAASSPVSDDWNTLLGDQVVHTLPKSTDPEMEERQFNAAVAGLMGIGPKDELESMMAAQLIAAHNAVMECYRRAGLAGQTPQGRNECLSQASKLSRAYAALLEALNRHRGKGQQKVTVEHVHVYAGGQAVVGVVEHTGGGHQINSQEQPHASKLHMHLSPRCGARTRAGTQCQSPAMTNGRCRMHGGVSPGAPKNNKHALKHGHYTAEAIARRRSMKVLMADMRCTALRSVTASRAT